MPLRERIKRVFKSSSPNSSLSKTPTNKSSTNGKNSPAPDGGRWPSNVYAPGEPMPRPKYRAPVKKEHKEKLEAFSFSSAWRRRSYISEYSPMGSRMPSRRGSLLSRKSIGGKSARRGSIGDNKSTRGSIDARSHNGDNTGTGGQVKGRHAARATRLSAEIEAEGDDDVANVGLSRVNSRDRTNYLNKGMSQENGNRKPDGKPIENGISTQPPDSNSTDNGTNTNPPTLSPTENGTDIQPLNPHSTDAAAEDAAAAAAISAQDAHDHQPFTEEDLALAMQRSHLVVPTQS